MTEHNLFIYSFTHLEKELDEFKNKRVIMLMGDFAIKAINYVWKTKRPPPKGGGFFSG
jgi:uracil-DNA glycosylase